MFIHCQMTTNTSKQDFAAIMCYITSLNVNCKMSNWLINIKGNTLWHLSLFEKNIEGKYNVIILFQGNASYAYPLLIGNVWRRRPAWHVKFTTCINWLSLLTVEFRSALRPRADLNQQSCVFSCSNTLPFSKRQTLILSNGCTNCTILVIAV